MDYNRMKKLRKGREIFLFKRINFYEYDGEKSNRVYIWY